MVVRWTFSDPVTSEVYEFHINPDEGGTPAYKKSISYQSTSAPDGKTLVFEGQNETQTIEWSGAILTQAHHDALVTWWEKKRQILLTDDLNRQFWIYLIDFSPKRVRNITTPWKHDYSCSAIIVDWP